MPKLKSHFTYLWPFTPLDGEAHRSQDVDTLFTVNIPKHCGEVLVQATGENIRYTVNGTNPTAASGFVLISGNDPLVIPVTNKTTLKFISETAGAILQMAFGE
jgi:hypothetical protein